MKKKFNENIIKSFLKINNIKFDKKNNIDTSSIDSFLLIKLITFIEKNNKKKINYSKLKITDFNTIKKILSL